MMIQEARKFLDLDMVVQQIINVNDRSLFQEAINCYYAGSHRAAAILAWYATANCLKRRIFELKQEGDGIAQQEAAKLSEGEGGVGEEETLINSARKCELIDDFEEKSLRFSRDIRNKCAHPTGIEPPAEAIRHVLLISSQYVLCRRGYRGISYVRSIVTTQFDDTNFLTNSSMINIHCREIIERVPRRLWPQFVKIAAEERGGSHTEIWREKAHQFFQELLKHASDSMVTELTSSMQLFERESPEFFATLVGIDSRVARTWDHHKRSQIRTRLRQTSAVRLRPDEIHAWAILCAQDGFEEEDLTLIQGKFPVIARYLAHEKELLLKQKLPLVQLIDDLLRDDSTSTVTAGGCQHLFPTSLFEDSNSEEFKHVIASIVSEIIGRFLRDDKHRSLIEDVRKWCTPLIVQFLSSAEMFWLECSEDNPDDVVLPFFAREELQKRHPLAIPASFNDTVGLILKGELLPDWRVENSSPGEVFFNQLTDSDFSEHGLDRTAFRKFRDRVELDEFWLTRLGVKISPQQDSLLKALVDKDGMSVEDLANTLDTPLAEIEADIRYLSLQGMLLQQDEKHLLREDLRALLLPSSEESDS